MRSARFRLAATARRCYTDVMRNNTLIAIIIAFFAIIIAVFSGCDYTLAKKSDLPPVNIVCWQDGKDFFRMQAREAERSGGRIKIVDPVGTPGVTLDLNENSATCAVITSTGATFGPGAPAAPPKPAPKQAPVGGDAGPVTDAGPEPKRP